MSCLLCDESELDGREAICRACIERYGRQAQARKRDRTPRNEHDTRVATVITCTECGKVDRLPFVPRRREKVLCRDCAAKILDIHPAPKPCLTRTAARTFTSNSVSRRTISAGQKTSRLITKPNPVQWSISARNGATKSPTALN